MLHRIDWDRLLHLAALHRLLPLLYWNFRDLRKIIPIAVLQHVEDYFFQVAARNLSFTGELLRLLHLFESNNIRAVPFKGPVLAEQVYGNLGLREFSDLDILIRKKDILQARDLMLSSGYRFAPDFERIMASIYPPSPGIYPFSGTVPPKCRVEIHCELEPWFFPFDTDQILDRAQRKLLAGVPTWTLSAEDSLLLLCVHGTKHWWCCLESVCSVAELVRTQKIFDWNTVLEQARALGGKRMLHLGLLLAHRLLEAPLPDEVLAEIHSDPGVECVARHVEEDLFSEQVNPKDVLRIPLLHLRSRERLRDRIRYCLGLLMMPELDEAAGMPLPKPLLPLYWMLKPMNLVGRYAVALIERLSAFARGAQVHP